MAAPFAPRCTPAPRLGSYHLAHLPRASKRWRDRVSAVDSALGRGDEVPDPSHLALARQGSAALRSLLDEQPPVRLDLRDADLRRLDLQGATLRGANLRRARLHSAVLAGADLCAATLIESDLCGADLSGADLHLARLDAAALIEARLSEAHLSGAQLNRATLSSANLRGADLSHTRLELAGLDEANLSSADLSGAALVGADLRGADLTGATANGTLFAHVDLHADRVRGLSAVQHFGPSSISTDTLVRSQGGIPPEFLRGCGLQDWEIEAARLYDPGLSPVQIEEIQQLVFDLRADPFIQMLSAFISHAHSDKPFARKLHEALQAEGVRCWLDERNVKVGQDILEEVLSGIRLHDRVILCCSRASLTSAWVEVEIQEALEKEELIGRRVILPVDLDGYLFEEWKGPLAVQIRKRLAADFVDWSSDTPAFDTSFKQLIEALRTDESDPDSD